MVGKEEKRRKNNGNKRTFAIRHCELEQERVSDSFIDFLSD